MIKLNDLLNLTEEQAANTKIRFNMNNGHCDPIQLYQDDREKINKEWLYTNGNKSLFQVGQIAICLVRMLKNKDQWLLTTIDTVSKDLNKHDGVGYEGTPIKEYEKYFGRVIVKFHNEHEQLVRWLNNLKSDLEVSQILPDTFRDDSFPGYDNVKLSYSDLKRIVKNSYNDWIAALSSQKAVYLITDTNTGKLYVGSATSNNGMLLKRWKDYLETGHGGNEKLIKLVEAKGIKYIEDHFQYSILENYNANVDDDFVLGRESWWKEVLKSKDFGYNANK
ncbi:GIY-YIG nuclease family protein [Bifidobacterium sp. UMB6791A]|nr:GIY-YIG nuclease family protein [Bifidobacterium sp. UMB6791B]MDK8248356.1 GIY-YIG nuclease family protein [Bifidobacterium sp. UMB6794B]MDK8635524.1 GIY-YIG nuclease family protein [Bifidobacterium sp. UMB6791A]